MKKRPPQSATPQGPIIGFACTKIPARLLRSSCGMRHRNASTPWKPGERKVKVFSEVCANCGIGAAHLKGLHPAMWDDGTPIMPVELVPVKSLVRLKAKTNDGGVEYFGRR